MSRKIYDLAVKTGTYINRDGEEKNRYKNIGAMLEGSNGQFLLLDRCFNPAGVGEGESCIVSLFEPRQQDGNERPQQAPPRQNSYRQDSPPPRSGNTHHAPSAAYDAPPPGTRQHRDEDVPF
jgi:hypothetical protein